VETLLKACAVQPVLDHALPFRVMFEEHLRRQKGKLLAQVANFYPTATNTLITLEGLITAQGCGGDNDQGRSHRRGTRH
jgi:hypothetical protein